MQFIQSFLLIASSLLLLYMAQYSFMNRKTPGAFEFFILLIATVIWSMGSFCEIYATTLQIKIFWRNIQQIGVFSVPVSTVYFSMVYTRNAKYLKAAYAATIPSVLSVLLIYTNDLHHLMRTGCELVDSAVFGKSLVVHLTVLGSVLVAYNFVLPLISIVILLAFSRKVSPQFRKQVYYIILSFLLTFIVAWAKTAILEEMGVYIEISVLYIPSALIMYYCIFRHRTFNLSPIARDKVFEVISKGIVVMDEDGKIVDTNSSALNYLKEYFHITDPLGSKLKEMNTLYPALNDVIGSGAEGQMELSIEEEQRGDTLSFKYYPLYHNKKDFIGSVLIINNITVQKLFERSLQEKAENDFLTRILNKFGFQKALQQSLDSSDGGFQSYSVLMLDLDNFKLTNDTFGHAVGDMLLCHFADVVKSVIRSRDIAGRIGGDEFVVVLPDVLKEEALQIAERIRTTIAGSEVAVNNEQKIRYTVSIGIADSSTEGMAFDEILERADKALYEAKHKSRNCTVVATERHEMARN